MNITLLGAGAWGTALAVAASHAHEVTLWVRDAAQAHALSADHENRRYLPGVVLPASLHITADRVSALAKAQLVVMATPMSALRQTLAQLHQDAHAGPVLWLSKGFEAQTGCLGHEIAEQLQLGFPVGVLSGPSFAMEVARAQPTALVIASRDAPLSDLAVQAFHSQALRVYKSTDMVGVEVGGAVKNVLAIATGIADGLSLGLNARAALITRGLSEMARLGMAMGAQAETLMGLAGLGDLVLTATGDLSRNRKVGLLLAQGLSLPQVLQELGHVAEGVYSAHTVAQRAQTLGVAMPITEAVVKVLQGRITAIQGLQALMSREAKTESVF